MSGFSADDVISHLRALKLQYIRENIGSDPSRLPNHFSEFLGYASLLYDHYAEYLKEYEIMETKVVQEENDRRDETNKVEKKRENKISIAEVDKRVEIRLGTLTGEKKRLEQAVKGATLHINGCQSLMKNWSDESKGIR